MTDDKYPKLTFCWKENCAANITGFRFNSWKVCSFCKCELSDALYENIKKREERKKSKEVDNDNLDMIDIWGQH